MDHLKGIVMKIKELHKDIERYLLNDCYCPHEIYSFDGFFYTLFYEDQECEKIGEKFEDNRGVVGCIAHPGNNEESKPQVVLFVIVNDKVDDAITFDATDNNVELAKIFIEKGNEGLKASGKKFDEYENGATAKSLKEILSIADAVIIN